MNVVLRRVGVLADAHVFDSRQLAADEQFLDALEKAIPDGVDLIVAVGAGTINDLVKLLRWKIQRPYISIPTAPSMDGYTSSVASLIFSGVKMTKPAQAPAAVYADLDILAAAPLALKAAGIGEMLSEFTALADCTLANRIFGEA